MSSEAEFQHLVMLGWYCKTQLFVQGLFLGMGVIWHLILQGTANKSGEAAAEAGSGHATREAVNLK